MDNEPNKKMDEALRTLATKRREQAGAEPSLHPATRRMLLGEVKRVYAKPGAKKQGRWIAMLFPHIAATLAVTLLLGAAVVLLKGNKEVRFANAPKSEPGQDATTGPSTAGESLHEMRQASSVEPAPSLKKELADETQDQPREVKTDLTPEIEQVAEKRMEKVSRELTVTSEGPQKTKLSARIPPSLPEPKPVPEKELALAVSAPPSAGLPLPIPASPTSVLSEASEGAKNYVPAQTELGVPSSRPVELLMPLAKSEVGQAGKAMNLGGALRVDFQAITNPGARPVPNALFSRFQFEQAGEQVRFTEAEGGVYTGTIVSRDDQPKDYFSAQNVADSKSRSTSLNYTVAGVTNATNIAPPAGVLAWVFRATGFNPGLGKQLIFEGQYFNPTNQIGTNLLGTSNVPRLQVPLVVGRATTDGTNWVPVRAVAPR